MCNGTIFFNDLSMPFALIVEPEYIPSILVFIPYSDEDILRLIENNINLTVVEDEQDLKGRYLRIRLSLSDIKTIIFEHN